MLGHGKIDANELADEQAKFGTDDLQLDMSPEKSQLMVTHPHAVSMTGELDLPHIRAERKICQRATGPTSHICSGLHPALDRQS